VSGRSTTHHDVIVIGGGPSGSSCAFWLAEAGHDVLLVEKKKFPREKTCGDGLTPRSVKQLEDMGLGGALTDHHRFDGLRTLAFDKTLEMKWPSHPELPSYGYIVTRHDLDQLVAERAEKAGATVWQETEALEPIYEHGLLRGATVKRKANGEVVEVRGKLVVIADGANSRFGRAIGTTRNKDYPQGMAIRGYFTSPRHDDPMIESHLDLKDRDGHNLPGYGWIFPVGDGRINVGVGLLSTFNRWKSVNTTHLMESFVETAPKSWGISPDTACGPATGGRLPMAFSVQPNVGPTHLVVGDAAGSINPFNGEGIAYAYETGRIAAGCVDTALRHDDGLALQDYSKQLQATYGLYYKVARVFVKIIGRPEIMRACVGTGMHSRTLMEWILRIMSNMLRPDELGPAEAAYRAAATLARITPGR
jgi:menaquinone-9 beta-reductase